MPALSDPNWVAFTPNNYSLPDPGTYRLYGWVKDGDRNISDSKNFTVVYSMPPDIEKPVITTFTGPSTAPSAEISITLYGSDNIGITHWLVNEFSVIPAVDDPGWSMTKPNTYTFANEGAHTLYAWAKDAAGNISDSRSLFVTFTIPLLSTYFAIGETTSPAAVAIGDVNNDGLNDIVATNEDYLLVFTQKSTGGYNSPASYPHPKRSNTEPQSVDIGDVNHDHLLDVVIGDYDSIYPETGSYIGIYYQNASGLLDSMREITTVNAHSIKVGDLNNDGRDDIVGLSWGFYYDTLDIILQNEVGDLERYGEFIVNHGGYDEVAIGDMNNDNLNDIVVMSGQFYADDNIGILPQRSDHTYANSDVVYYDLGFDQNTCGVAIGDINNDTRNDLAVTYGGNAGQIGVFLQNGSGTLDPVISYYAYDCPEPIEIADIDRDGRKDVIVAHGGWQKLSVYLQNTNGGLNFELLFDIPYASHYSPQGLAVGDVNNDGYDDVVIADYNNGVIILYNQSHRP